MSHRKAHVIDDRERTVDIQIEENVDFRSMYLSEEVLSGLMESGFERPSPIQLAAIPLGRCGLDMIVQAKSGTGKTCVFTVVALEMISVAASTTQVLVLAPTREIAVQVSQVMNAIGCKIKGLRISTFIGGIHLSLDKVKLKGCHIAVGTPGRITQLIEMGLLCLNNIRLFVLDEADQLLTGQFADGIAHIASGLPLNKQVLALSATYTEDVAKVAEGLMRSPNHVRLGKDCPALLGVDQFVKLLPYHHQPHRRQQTKFQELMNILCTVTFNQCLVFSNSQLRAESVCNKLRAAGWPVNFLTGGQAQKDRLVALDALCSYKCRVLVSTDLSARGLDSEHVNLVINLDLPREHSTYLHRIGRAGRFGSRGSSITLVTEGEEWQIMRAIASLANVQIALLKGDLTSDITIREGETQEFVEYLTGDDFTDYLNAVNACENEFVKNGKSKKSMKTKTVNGNKQSSDSESVIENLTIKKKRDKGKTKVNGKSKKSPQRALPKELDSKTKTKKREEEQCRNLNSVMDILKRLKLEPSSSTVSFNEIMEDISSKYDYISADDNPVVTLPSLPNYVDLSVADKNELLWHWNHLEDKTKEVVLSTNDSWKDFMISVEKALHSRMEGEVIQFERVEKVDGINNDLRDGSESGSCSSSDTYSEEEEQQQHSVPSKHMRKGTPNHDTKDNGNRRETPVKNHKVKNNSLRKEIPTMKHKAKSDTMRKETGTKKKVRKSRSTIKESERFNDSYIDYPYYYGHDPRSYYAAYASEQESSSCSGSTEYNSNLSHSSYGASYGNYMKNSMAMYQRYVDHAEKFSAMMDYVQTMGKLSSWIARDYYYGS